MNITQLTYMIDYIRHYFMHLSKGVYLNGKHVNANLLMDSNVYAYQCPKYTISFTV